MDNEKKELSEGKIYHIDYGNSEVVGRYKNTENDRHNFYDLLHYWDGHEVFRANNDCKIAGIKNMRRASKSEIHNLLRYEINNDCI